jgi:hypothetical protein
VFRSGQSAQVAGRGLFISAPSAQSIPKTTAIFDFVPDRLLLSVRNLAEYAGMYVFDQWLWQADKRQLAFVLIRVAIKSSA